MSVHFSSQKDEWETPQDLFDELDAEFKFTLDVCATHENVKCERYFTKENNGLTQDWSNPYRWIYDLIPFELLEFAQGLVNCLSFVCNMGWDTPHPPNASLENVGVIQEDSCFLCLGAQEWLKEPQNKHCLFTIGLPTPTNPFVILSRIIFDNCSNTERIHKELYRRLVYHLNKNFELKIRTSLVWAAWRSIGFPINIDAAFSIEETSAPSNEILIHAAIHSNIIPHIDGLIKDAMFPPPTIAFCNPPYGREISKWIKKAHESSLDGATVVCLIPARTDTSYWHRYIFPYAEVRFLKGRLKFSNSKNSAPFPSAVVIFRKEKKR